MRRNIVILAANGMAAFMDFGVGTLIASFFSIYFDTPFAWYHLVLGGVIAFLPDFDMIPSVVRGKSAPFDHRVTLWHRPLLVIPVATVIAYYMGGEMWAAITVTAVFWHYLHDTNFIAPTYGIAWFWPFSTLFWSVFGSFEQPALIGHHDWLRQHWFSPTAMSMRELIIGSGALATALQLIDWPLRLDGIVVFLLWIAFVSVWYLARTLPTLRE